MELNRIMRWVFPLIGLLAAVGCRKPAAPGSGAAAPPPVSGGGGGMAVQVVAVKARLQPVEESITLLGTLAANEMVEIKCETEGVIRQVNFREGQLVEAGQLLVTLDETKLAAELAEAEAAHRLAQTSLARADQLLKEKLISPQEFDQNSATFAVREATLDLKRRQLKDARIVAPFRGVVAPATGVANANVAATVRQISPGQVINRNTVLTWLVDLETVKLELTVPERFLSQIREGQKLSFKVAAYPKETFAAEIYAISPQLDPATRTALVKARSQNPGLLLRGGMVSTADLKLQLRDAAVVIPEPALMNNGDSTFVYAIDDKTNAVMRPVQVGVRLAGKAEVVSGLKAGEWVVVEGTQKLRPGAPVRFSPEENAAPYLK